MRLVSNVGLRTQESEDRFAWRLVTAERQGGCIVIEARMTGAYQNLDYVSVQLEPLGSDAGCPECPFNPVRILDIGRDSANFEEIGPYVRLVVCDLEAGRAYKWRILGHHALRGFRPVFSEVQTLTP